MAKIKLKVDIVSAINDFTDDRSKRIAFKRVMANPDAKRAFGNRVIDTIIDRTLEGRDKFGSRFAPYSAAYKKSLAFRIYQKSPSKVTLKLTGAMQSAIRVTNVDARTVEIGITDDAEAEKASGHIDGANDLPVRDFWGLSVKERDEILKETLREFSDELSAAVRAAVSDIGSEATPNGGTQIDVTVDDEG